jgi:hypothetical protein
MHDASAVIRRLLRLAATGLCGAVCCAGATEEDDSGIPPLRDLPPLEGDIPQLGDEEPTAVPAAPTQNQETLQLISKGIVLQKELLGVLRGITDKKSADNAAKKILRLASDLRVWGAALDARPVEDEVVMGEYERKFMPTIDQLNREIRQESERLLTYQFFGSVRLEQALVELVRQAQ